MAALMRWAIREADNSNPGASSGASLRMASGVPTAQSDFGSLRRIVAGQRRFAPGERARAPGRRRRCHFAVHAPAASRTHS